MSLDLRLVYLWNVSFPGSEHEVPALCEGAGNSSIDEGQLLLSASPLKASKFISQVLPNLASVC
jgi:hypothetical protein